MKKLHTFITQVLITALFIAASLCAAQGLKAAQDALINTPPAAVQPPADNSTAVSGQKPLVVYYSRTGNARMVATGLAEHLGCGSAEIVSKSKKGVFTIMLDQLFNRSDEQLPLDTDLAPYNPVLLVTPIWFMRLSSPARTLIKSGGLKDKDVYLFTTSGGPVSEGRHNAFKEFGREHGLKVQDVFSLQIGKKKQADYDNETKKLLEKTPLLQAPKTS